MRDQINPYDRLLDRFVAWAEGEPSIRGALIVGSRARAELPADAWSDLDLVLLVEDPDTILGTDAWLTQVAEPWLTFVEPTATGGGMERRVLFADGLDVDFVPLPVAAARQMAEAGFPPEIAGVVGRGIRVVLDKDGLAGQLAQLPIERRVPQVPDEHAVLESVSDFLYHAVWAAKKIRRGELWTAKACSDGYMKWLLLRMAEWHAHATHGWSYNTWHNGRFLERWADPRVVEGLHDAFAHYDLDDIVRGLLATLDLYRWLARETMQRLGYAYPNTQDEPVTALVRALLEKPAEIEGSVAER